MATKKKVSEGIALLSVYFDEEDDDVEEDTYVDDHNNYNDSIPQENEGQNKTVNIEEDVQKEMDPLDKFLPPPPTTKCSHELQEKIISFLGKTGRSYNSEVRKRKAYCNPDFLLHVATYQGIDQIGSCFSKLVFDPHGCIKSDYYDEIEADLKRVSERKEQEKKENQKIDFVCGGTLSKVLAVAGKNTVAGGGSSLVRAAIDTGTREGRPNKKSKWDKLSFCFKEQRSPAARCLCY